LPCSPGRVLACPPPSGGSPAAFLFSLLAFLFSIFYFRHCTLPPQRQQLPNRAVSLINGYIRVSASPGIRIRNGYPSERLSPLHPRLLAFFPLRIKHRIRRERITVRPAIHGNPLNVIRRIEPRAAQHARQLLAD